MIKSSVSIAHTRPTSKVMSFVSFCLIPGMLAEVIFLGWGVLINLILCSAYAISAEALVLKIRKKPIKEALSDNSALLTGLLLALALPPIIPWWMSLIGVYFAIVIAKQLYGGLGFNPFNPAMVGYVLLLISFPVEMTNWLPEKSIAIVSPGLVESLQLTFLATTSESMVLQNFRNLVDGYTMATPLDESKTAYSLGLMTSEIIQDVHFFPNFKSWLWINICFLFGGFILLFNRIIHWQIPLSMLLSILLISTILYTLDNQLYLPPWFHLFSGATMLGAFFIATDPVSAATTPKGRVFYGAIIGLFIVIIRVWGGYPDAIAFSVLLLNIAAPTIDYYTKPKVYGSGSETDTRIE